MAFTPVPTKNVGNLLDAAAWNTYLRDNMAALFAPAVTRSAQLFTAASKNITNAAYQDIDASLAITVNNLVNKRLLLALTGTITTMTNNESFYLAMSVGGVQTLVYTCNHAAIATALAFPLCVMYYTEPLNGSVVVKPQARMSAGTGQLWDVIFSVIA